MSNVLALTHAFLAYSLSEVFDRSNSSAVFAALFPDLDIFLNFASPFVRNGVVHSVLFGVICVFLVQIAFARRNISEGFVIGFISHLGVDFLSLNGIMLLFPLQKFLSIGLITEYSAVANLAILSISSFAILEKRSKTLSKIVRSLISQTSIGSERH